MKDRESRRRFLQDLSALSVAGGVYAAAGNRADAQDTRLAQAQAGATPDQPAPAARRGLPRIQLMMGPGTLPSVGKDRMDMVSYRRSGNPRLTGEQLLAPLPEIAEIARVDVDKGNPWDIAAHDDLRKIAVRMNEVLRSPEIDGAVFVQGTASVFL
jgi:hypothetical protein